ncbi:hypothetical protein CSOJ01_15038 [Colletotrichum sojae]|uniref:Uncharacterized protein n=1 Tax=Colletotrichum sojae TaxID=2175907 RepID=A0A8H6ING3_9PEZI|nr:hypothetical protein CSOJ01_15038 [Colletotrichum sojae]
MPPLFAPIFAQPTSTITLTLAAPSVPPFPQLPPLVVPVPAPMFPGLLPPPQQSSHSTSSSQPPPQPTPQAPPQQPPAQQQPPPRPPIQQQPPPALQPQVPRPSSSSSSTPQIRPPPPAAATPPPQASSSAPAGMPNVGGGGPEKQPDKQGEDKENAEKSCICGNKSFDVQLLAGMCQSCIRQSGNRANDMDFIMSQCNFSESRYTRDKDDLVYNIRVVAQKPMLSHSANAMGDAGRLPAGCAAAVAVAVSFVAGVALLL